MINFARGVNSLWFPPDVDAPLPTSGAPSILFLHGIGERGRGGDDLARIGDWGLPKFRTECRELTEHPFPFFLIAPQCPPDRTWCDEDLLNALDRLVEEIAATEGIDGDRIHLSGFSMGGIGAFCLALRHPARFSSLSSVCGRCPTPEALSSLADLPAWIAYAEDDEITELASGSRLAAQALAKYANIIEMPYRLGSQGDLGPHVRTCDAAYAERQLYRWLLDQPAKPNRRAGYGAHER